MAKRARSKRLYYYSGGERIALEPAPGLAAVDVAAVERFASPAERRALEHAMSDAKMLRRGMALVDVSSVAAPVLKDLREHAALQPVLRYGSDLVIVLPEVRVEESRPAKLRALRRWIDSAGAGIRCSGSLDRGRVEIRPASGRGQDALEIANELHERVGPELAQARFVRVVRRPDAGRRAR